MHQLHVLDAMTKVRQVPGVLKARSCSKASKASWFARSPMACTAIAKSDVGSRTAQLEELLAVDV